MIHIMDAEEPPMGIEAAPSFRTVADLGKWSVEQIDEMLAEAGHYAKPGEKIEFLSRLFLGTAYEGSTLIGGAEQPEALVLNLRGVDCFTFIDYVEAMRLSLTFSGLADSLRKIRYREGKVSFSQRNHFFSDWIEHGRDRVEDVTASLGQEHSRQIEKFLNRREDGTLFVPGIEPIRRRLSYIPSESMKSVSKRLRTGDYAGIYSPAAGLDVSHVGILVVKEDIVLLRHASSEKTAPMVKEADLLAYMRGKAGLIVLRPR